MKRRQRQLFTLLALLGAAAAGGCKGDGATTIKTLLDDPSRYDKQVVRIAGRVGHSLGVMGYGAYEVEDGTGTLIVVSKENGAPREAATVGVEGEFRSAYTVGEHTGAVLLERQRFTP